jgi:hypothetical protein
MFDAILNRDQITGDCILGTLIAKGEVFYTLELPWIENTHDVSCIPTGAYKCRLKERSNDGRISQVYEVLDVPDREGILIHPGNSIVDTKGCILVALGRDICLKKIINSKIGLEKLIEKMGKEFTLSIS